MQAQVLDALGVIRGVLQDEGGDIRMVDLDPAGGVLTVELLGACGDCPMAAHTLKFGVEQILKDRVPGLREVRAVGVPVGPAEAAGPAEPVGPDDGIAAAHRPESTVAPE